MFKSGFFKVSKNKRFNYTPRYYDADKEALHDKVKRAEAIVEADKKSEKFSPYQDRIKFERKRAIYSPNYRLLILFVLLSIGMLMYNKTFGVIGLLLSIAFFILQKRKEKNV